MPQSLTERLSRCYTGVVHDVMRGMGLRDFTFPPELRPLVSDAPLAGPVFTVLGKVDAEADGTRRSSMDRAALSGEARSYLGVPAERQGRRAHG
jgi:hypothetical protein